MDKEKFENIKKEIRSLLISYQKGTSLSEFGKEYRGMIGRRLPFQDFGYRDEYSFLKAMPDVVKVYPSPVPGDYHLMGVADESVKHIQQMVCKQKTSKHKTRYRAPRNAYAYSSAPPYTPTNSSTKKPNIYSSTKTSGFSRGYELPPRFNKKELPKNVDQYVIKMLNNYPNGVKLSQFLTVFSDHYKRQFVFRDWGFTTLEECLETIPGITAKNKNNDIIVHLIKSNLNTNHQAQTAVKQGAVSKDITNHPPKNRSQPPSVESSTLNPKAPDFFDRNFNKNENKSNSPSVHNSKASTDNYLINRMLQDNCSQSPLIDLESNIAEPKMKDQVGSSSAYATSPKMPGHDNQVTFKTSKTNLLDDYPLVNFKDKPATNHLLCDNFNDVHDKHLFAFDSPLVKEPEDTSVNGVPRVVRNNLIKMIEKNSHGIFAVQFSSCYEKAAGCPFDLHSLGFNNLSELIDAVPDILVRKELKGSKKDWIIYSADSAISEAVAESGPAEVSALHLECIILNIRKILQANPEGIPISAFIHHYSINCSEPLYIRDQGFDNLEDFLLSVAQRVPLEINIMNGEKIVSFVNFQDVIKPPISPLQKPAAIAPLDSKFQPFEFPSDFDYSKYFPVYTSSIATPGLLYIQFEDENSEYYKTLYNDIDKLYSGDLGDLYRMKPADIKANVSCIALWPVDKQWYRAKITSIVSLDFVQVFYVDYGTIDEIPMHMLRYIKNDFLALPAQAVKACLAHVKPFPIPGQNPVSWDKRTRRRMLELCQDRPLMAKIEYINNDGVLALILCDTSKDDEDVFINDVLVNENLVILDRKLDGTEQPVLPVDPTQNIQQIFELMKLVAASPEFSSQLQNLSLNSLPNQTPFGFTSPQSLPPMSQQFPNISSLIGPSVNTSIPSFGNSLNFSNAAIPPPKYPPGFNIQSPEATSNIQERTDNSEFSPLNPSPPLSLSPEDEEVFDDDDDEFFEQLCQKNIDTKPRFVKRVKTTDGYFFHVLLFNSQPYISSGDISILIWHAKAPSYLFHKLQAQEIELDSMTLMENGNEEFFVQLERFKVKGIEKMGSETSVLLYPLSKANRILNLFGHPSATLRAKINTEIATFNPSSSHWLELFDSEVPEELEDIRIVTDDDKMNRLCLYDLKTMREGIRCKRLKLVKRKEVERTNTVLDEEISKLNQLSNKVRERIIEIDQIISMFSERKR